MPSDVSRAELVQLVERIMNARGTEEELERLLSTLEANVPHPRVSDLIFFPDKQMSAEEIVDAALAYRPFGLPASLDQ